jgi:ABC-2 type transport system ATP-binding protein
MNLVKRNAGEIKVLGLDNMKKQKDIKQRIGFVYDENYFYEELNLIEMKNIISPFYKHWDDKVFHKYIYDFNLPKKKKIKELSKGMKMKYSLAVALSHGAEFIIMDEPTSSLDFGNQHVVLEKMRYLSRKGMSILMVTHDPDHALFCASQVVMIKKGCLLKIGSPDETIQEETMQDICFRLAIFSGTAAPPWL